MTYLVMVTVTAGAVNVTPGDVRVLVRPDSIHEQMDEATAEAVENKVLR